MASGFTIASPYDAPHYRKPAKTAKLIDLRFDVLLDPRSEMMLPLSVLAESLPDLLWNPQGGGTRIPPDAAVRPEELWHLHLARIGLMSD